MSTELQNSDPISTPLVCRGVRGATTVTENSKEAILDATRELLYLIVRENSIQPADLASAYFTTTVDLNATYPALAARQLGWYDVALMCGHEMQVPGGLPNCIRVLLHWNTRRTAKEIVHVYIKGAKHLRPDRSEVPEISPEELEAAIKKIEAPEFNADRDDGERKHDPILERKQQ